MALLSPFIPFRRLLRLRSKFSVIVLANFVCLFVVYTFLNESNEQKLERLGHIDPRTYYRVRINLGPLINKTVPTADTFNYGPCEEDRKPPSIDIKETFSFTQVHPESRETYVYSAFYDPRYTPPAVRVLGLSSGEDSLSQSGVKKYCQIWYADQNRMEVSSAEYQIIPETHDRKYAISIHLCYLRRHPSFVPYAVSLVSQKCEEPTHVLKMNFYSYSTPSERNYTVCVSPLNMNYNKAKEFVNIMESNRLLGAQKIVFYNYSVGPEVNSLLKTYVEDGFAEVLPWKVPVPVDVWPPDPQVIPEIHYFAQLGALTDCLYRNMFTSQYVVFTDLDELIVPHKANHKTWNDMFEGFTKDPTIGSHLFQCAFYRMDWPDDPRAKTLKIDDLGQTTLIKTMRENHTFPHYTRSKYIVNPRLIDMIGVHFVFEFLDNRIMSQNCVFEDQALLHHYRLWEDDGRTPGHRDHTMYKYKFDLLPTVRHRLDRARIKL